MIADLGAALRPALEMLCASCGSTMLGARREKRRASPLQRCVLQQCFVIGRRSVVPRRCSAVWSDHAP